MGLLKWLGISSGDESAAPRFRIVRHEGVHLPGGKLEKVVAYHLQESYCGLGISGSIWTEWNHRGAFDSLDEAIAARDLLASLKPDEIVG